MSGLDVIDIDLGSSAGTALRAAVGQGEAASLLQMVPRLGRLFLMRSPWAPGLRFVGGQVDGQEPAVAAFAGGSVSLAGSGETVEAAFVGCLGEAAERLAQVERPGDVIEASYAEAGGRVLASAREIVAAGLNGAGLASDAPLSWQRARRLGDGAEVLVPADWSLRRFVEGPLREAGSAASSGAAAGGSVQTAATRALLELIERDAAALWWHGGRRGRPLSFDSPGLQEAARVVQVVRQDRTERMTWVMDITSDIAVPVAAAISVDGDGCSVAFGLAARPAMAEAARAAVLELGQMEIGLLIARMRSRAGPGQAMGDTDRRHLARADGLDAATCALLLPDGAPRRPVGLEAGAPAAAQSAFVAQALATAGIEAAVVDLTRRDLGAAAVKAIAPDLQPLPGDRTTRRLQAAVDATGGGAEWHRGIALI